jgi:Asp-tRNA(Asn)/Glu-tRNA(Gln) amidotransferase A subunit family amidase
VADAYDPAAPRGAGFIGVRADFIAGRDTPGDYLERHLETIYAREDSLRAFAALDPEGARAAAAATTRRYRDGAPLSAVDGLPIAFKDIFEVRGLPTAWGVAGLAQTAPRDAAIVNALRRGGAVIVGKTTLPELGFGEPPPTRNPHDETRSPGGSSSGSAAAVGANMVPVAIGTQGKGSLTRPASFCGAFAFKPGHGTIHRGGDGGGQETNTHVGVLAAVAEDAWLVARYLSQSAGPHPGHAALHGPMEPPPATAPRELLRLTAAGWDKTAPEARAAFDALCTNLAQAGIKVGDAEDLPEGRALADDLNAAAHALDVISDYESRWPLIMYLQGPDAAQKFSPRVIERGLARDQWSRDDYEDALRFRRAYREKLDACRAAGRFFISPSATGPAPSGTSDTGSSVYQWGSSLAGNPVCGLPLMAAGGLPLGLELQGFSDAEAELMAAARALIAAA